MTLVSRRQSLAGISALAASTALARRAKAEGAWPTKRVTLVVGFSSGGFADSVTRALARKLGERWNQPVVVQNMPGAGGNIAARSVSIASPDGYTLLATTTSLAINETLNKDKGFALDALAPVAIAAQAPELLAANPKSGIRTMEDVLRVARQGKLFMGTSGIGSGSHISAEYFFRKLAKVDVKHIPFPGGNPAKLALLTGDVNLMASTATVVSSIVDGQLVGIAAGGVHRSPLLPQVPTYTELGYPGFTPSSWAGLFAPAGAPAEALDAVNAAVNDAVGDAEVRKFFATMGLTSRTAPRSEVAAFFTSEVTTWGTMVKALGLQG